MARPDVTDIIVAVHGVGSPAPGAVAQNLCEGFARAYPGEEMTTKSLLLRTDGDDPRSHIYRGIEVHIQKKALQIWEVNWSDLKGLPDGKIGTALYALKAVVAMMQITDQGWRPESKGVAGPLFFGAVVRTYFCAFSLVAPLVMLAIAFAFIQSNAVIGFTVLTAFALCVFMAFLQLLGVDRRFALSFPVLAIGIGIAGWLIVVDEATAKHTLPVLIKGIGAIESLLGLIVFLALVELVIRHMVAKPAKSVTQSTWTIFIARAGMAIVAVTMGAAVYASIVNAVGFFLLDKLRQIHAVSHAKYNTFQDSYLTNIGYNLGQMELINWITTFAIGAFLVAGVGYQIGRIRISGDTATAPRGLYIQNILNSFLWLSLAGFAVVFVAYFADQAQLFDSDCPRDRLCSIYGIQWIFTSAQSIPVSPLDIYAASATRIVPFLLPVFISSVRVALNVTADVLLYILPSQFPFSVRETSRCRLMTFLQYLRTNNPEGTIAVVAHSQGTVVARDVLKSQPLPRFVTAGSPLASLYGRFLGEPVEGIPDCHWVNIYRPSDYIAGPLMQEDIKDVRVTANYSDNHIHYFDNREMVLVAEELRSSVAKEPIPR